MQILNYIDFFELFKDIWNVWNLKKKFVYVEKIDCSHHNADLKEGSS